MNNVSELNKAKVRVFVDEIWNQGRLELIGELIADDYVGHLSCTGTVVTGPEGVRWLVASRRGAHPGLYIKIEDQIAEDDQVVTRWQATTAAPAAPAAPGDVSPCCAGISVTRLLAGKLADSRTECTRAASCTICGPAEDSRPRSPRRDSPA